MYGIGKRKNHSGRLCPLFKQCHGGGRKEEGGEEGEEETRGSGYKTEEASRSCPA